jgi:ribosomal protein L11 methylase PrmA
MSLRTRLSLLVLGLFTWIMWTLWKGAPWVPTDRRTVRKMLAMARVQVGEVVYDLGSGDGRILTMAARDFGARAVGVEIDPLRYGWSRLRIALLGLRGQACVVYGNLFDQDLSQADVVTCYLLQDTNDRLAAKLANELRPGARVVSNTYTFTHLQLVRSDEQDKIFVYTKTKDG